MVTYTPINLTSDRSEFSQSFEKALKSLPIFISTQIVNAHVLYNFKSPTSQFGEYDYILFLDIPYGRIENKTNFCKWNNVFVNSLAIAVRNFIEPDVIDADNNSMFTEDGSWDYREQIEEERISLRKFVLENVPDVKYFDLAVIYHVIAPKCNKVFYNENFAINQDLPLDKVVSYSIDLLSSRNVNALLLTEGGKSAVWKDFIYKFIVAADKHTRQGILTKKKVDAITRKNTSRLMDQAYNAIGNKLCIIRGNAGTGKTMALLRIMYNQIKKDENAESHHCRLLTYNNMLVMDMKQTMKSIGEFTPTNSSISTLHKFFYDIYKVSPVRVLHMDKRKIDEIFNLCIVRITKYNAFLKKAFSEINSPNVFQLIMKVDEMNSVMPDEKSEIDQYIKFLLKQKQFEIANLPNYLKEYVEDKREVFLNNYHRRQFLNGYNIIIKELYLIYHNLDEFINTYDLATVYAKEELRGSEQFKKQHEEAYDKFMEFAESKFINEEASSKDLMPDFLSYIEQVDKEIDISMGDKNTEELKKEFERSLKTIKRKINWSKYILVDEAQDCQLYEKALLLELNGSDNTVVATGGHSQLIRSAKENDWSICLGNRILTEKITLRNVSFRQKGNIVNFLNAFARVFNLDSQLSIPEETINAGRVIIDCRPCLSTIPQDIVEELYISGKDYGCSNFENLMFLLPKEGYIDFESTHDVNVEIDSNNTIVIKSSDANRKMGLRLPEEYNPIDCTINDKREATNKVGQDNTRCLLYESCRGLEAWNVLCIDLDIFYREKKASKDAIEYANSNAGLFESDRPMFLERYASLWCYMAMTRAMDTLYIKLSNENASFSTSLLSAAKQIPNIEILRGPIEDVPRLEEQL